MLVSGMMLIGIAPMSAQNTPEMVSGNLAEMLRFVPDTEDARFLISYGDYRAAEHARGLSIFPETYADFEALPIEETELWVLSLPRGGIGRTGFAAFGDMPTVMGFDFFQIDQVIQFGKIGEDGYVLRGNFDAEMIRVAHEQRGFVESLVADVPALCSAHGCDAGNELNRDRLAIADPFYGNMGWQIPRAVVGNLLISASTGSVFENMLTAGRTGSGSLADDPSYQAAVASLDGDYFLRSVRFMTPELFLEPEFSGRFAIDMTPERMREEWIALRGSKAELPLYDLVFIADAAVPGSESAIFGLAYDDYATAVSANDILVQRLESARSSIVDRTWASLFAELEIELETGHIYHDDVTDHAVVLITLTRAFDPFQQENGRYVPSAQIFGQLLSNIMRHDVAWLQPETTE